MDIIIEERIQLFDSEDHEAMETNEGMQNIFKKFLCLSRFVLYYGKDRNILICKPASVLLFLAIKTSLTSLSGQ